jgi:RNA polymerase sigma factor (sigma-70 family)
MRVKSGALANWRRRPLFNGALSMTDPRTDCFDAQRARLLSIAYRMLGSRAEAEDVVQDAWLKWHAADIADMRQPAAWLTTVVTRLSIDRLRAARTERAARQNGWLPDPWIDMTVPSAEQHALDGAQLSYGLMLLLERLSPDERAAFLLREAFDCDYATISESIGKPAVHCRQLVHRAKTRLARAGAPVKPADAIHQRRVVEQLRAAIDAQDQQALLDVLDHAHVISDTPEPVFLSTQTEAVSMRMGADNAVALMSHGNVTALCVPCFDVRGELTMYVIAQARTLASVNRMVGRAAILRLLSPIFNRALQPTF